MVDTSITSDADRAVQRRLLASTPPAPRWLHAHPFEDLVVRTVLHEGAITLPRFDAPRRSTDMTDEQVGAIRVFDRGLLRLVRADHETATWTWTSRDAESEGLRMLRTRTLGFLPYNLGYCGFTPETMTGPQLAAMLVWHYRHTEVTRLDITAMEESGSVGVREHHLDATVQDTTVPSTLTFTDGDSFENHTRLIHPHLDRPDHRFDAPVVAVIVTHLARRVGPVEFGTEAVTVDLNTWRLCPHGHGPRGVVEALPLDVQDALAVLGAPEFTDVDELLDWAATGLTMTVMCKVPVPDATDVWGRVRQSGSRRHVIRLDPFTGAVVTVPGSNVRQNDDLEGVHLLAALTDQTERLRCRLVADAWSRDGRLGSTPTVSWTDLQAERVLAVHRVAEQVRALARERRVQRVAS